MAADDEHAALSDAKRKAQKQVHELVNLLAIMQAEIEWAIAQARLRLDAYYEQYPEDKPTGRP